MHNHLVRSTVALILLGAFLAPNIAPSVHALLTDHEHFVCKAVDEDHLHEKHEHCELCDYLVTFKTTVDDEEEQKPLNSYVNGELLILDTRYSSPDCDILRLRGPPA